MCQNFDLENTLGLCSTNVSFTPSTQDNCGVSTVTQTSGTALTGSQFAVGFSSGVFVVRDVYNNTNQCTVTVRVRDIELPVIGKESYLGYECACHV